MNELITLIVPAYNIELWIENCLYSIKNQTYRKLEIIVINDGSTDKTGKICDQIAEMDDRIYVIHQENYGVGEARNIGIQLSHGKYICFVDGDDYLEPNYVDMLYQNIRIYDAQMSICDYQEEYENGKLRRRLISDKKIGDANNILNDLFFHDEIGRCLWNKMLIGTVIKENNILFQKEYLVGEDMQFLINYLKNISRVVFTNHIGYHYLWRDGSAMKKQQWNKDYYNNRISWIKAIKAIEKNLNDQKKVRNIFHHYKTLVYYRILCESTSFQANSKRKEYLEDILLHYVRKNGVQLIFSKMLTYKTAIGVFLCCISPKIQVKMAKIGRFINGRRA